MDMKQKAHTAKYNSNEVNEWECRQKIYLQRLMFIII